MCLKKQLNLASFKLKAVLFDLDGTLLDTAPDLAAALNTTLTSNGQQPLAYQVIRPYVSYGAAGLIKLAFGEGITATVENQLKQTLISAYQQNLTTKTRLFEGMPALLSYLKKTGLSWGIVTNKPHYLTDPIVKQLGLFEQADCIISGDQVKRSKPFPDSIQLACEKINIAAEHCVYLGDAKRDIDAGFAAGCKTIACEFGYIPGGENVSHWNANYRVQTVAQIQPWLEQQLAPLSA